MKHLSYGGVLGAVYARAESSRAAGEVSTLGLGS